MSIDIDQLADAIAPPEAPTRRAVARGVAWSLPVIATAIAAPTAAASPVCAQCSGDARPPQCFISGVPGGTCSCAPGLVCVGTGPFGLANVCVGTDLLVSTCGSSTCFGVCAAAGGALIGAVRTFLTALTAFASAVATVGLAGLRSCVNQPGIPDNVCIAPFNDGRLGSLCSYSGSCGDTQLISTALGTVTTAYNTLITTLGGLGILVSPRCANGLVCKDLGSVAFSFGGVAGVGPAFGVRIGLGFCQCPGAVTCGPGDDTPFGTGRDVGYYTCLPA